MGVTVLAHSGKVDMAKFSYQRVIQVINGWNLSTCIRVHHLKAHTLTHLLIRVQYSLDFLWHFWRGNDQSADATNVVFAYVHERTHIH